MLPQVQKATFLNPGDRNVAFLNFGGRSQSSAMAVLNTALGRITSSALALSTK